MAKSKNIESKVSLSLIIVTIISIAGYFFYETKSREASLNTDIEGLNEYELCQYANENFGMDMVKDMGCLKPLG